MGEKIKILDTHWPRAEFSHNHAVNRRSGFSPFQVIYGLLLWAPVDLSTLPDRTRLHGTASDFDDDIKRIPSLLMRTWSHSSGLQSCN